MVYSKRQRHMGLRTVLPMLSVCVVHAEQIRSVVFTCVTPDVVNAQKRYSAHTI
jgi:hypothetical protein